MKRIIILIVFLCFIFISCSEKITTTTAFPYYEKMEEILYPIEIELQNGITRTNRVLVSHMYRVPNENIAIYYSQDTEIYYIYKLNKDVLEDNCIIATKEQLEKIFY